MKNTSYYQLNLLGNVIGFVLSTTNRLYIGCFGILMFPLLTLATIGFISIQFGSQMDLMSAYIMVVHITICSTSFMLVGWLENGILIFRLGMKPWLFW